MHTLRVWNSIILQSSFHSRLMLTTDIDSLPPIPSLQKSPNKAYISLYCMCYNLHLYDFCIGTGHEGAEDVDAQSMQKRTFNWFSVKNLFPISIIENVYLCYSFYVYKLHKKIKFSQFGCIDLLMVQCMSVKGMYSYAISVYAIVFRVVFSFLGQNHMFRIYLFHVLNICSNIN